MKKIIFDIDDILWGLNERAAKMANLEYEKLTSFSVPLNKNLTKEEAKILTSVYENPSLFENIIWFNGIERIDSLPADVHIVSNIFQKEVDTLKRTQLHSVLNIPDEKIHLNLVTDATKKTIPEDTYIFVDDSPYNIAASPAKHNIMLKRPWNQSENGKQIIGDKPVKMFDTLNEIIDYIETLLK